MTFLIRIIFLFCILNGFSQNTNFSALTVDPSLKENADSVVREEHITLDLTNPRVLEEQVYKVVSVFNKTGNSDVQAYAYYDDDRKVKDIRATIYDVMGNEIREFKERDFKDVSAVSGGTLYADDRVLYLDYTPTSYPYTVVFESKVRSRTTAFLPRWIPVANYASSTAHATYEVLFEEGTALHIKEERLEAYNIKSMKEPGRYYWEAKNIEATKKEYLAPSFDKLMPVVKCAVTNFSLKGVTGTASSWKGFGSWMNDNLIKGNGSLPEETVTHIKNMVNDLQTDTEKAKAVYKYVQDKVRYISVQEGIGGWKPMPPAEVDHLGYGDCKALSNYTRSLLEVAGVPAYYTVLYGGNAKRSIDKDFIAMQGNHVILALPLDEKMTWLECTSQEVPFGYLGDFTDDRDVLVLKNDGGVLAHTKSYGQEANFKQIEAHFQLDEKGLLTGTLERMTGGIFYGDKLSLQHLNKQKLRQHYFEEMNTINRLQIDDILLKNDRETVTFKETLQLKAASYLSPVGEDFLLQPNPFGFNRDNIPRRYSDRESTFALERGSTHRSQFHFSIPKGYSVESLPEATTITTQFGTYTSNFHQDGTAVIYTRSFNLNEGIYPAEQYNNFRSFYKDVVRADAQKLLIKPQS